MKRVSWWIWIAIFFCSTEVWAATSPSFAEGSWRWLFNGRNLKGWRILGPSRSFRVEKGTLVAQGPHAYLIYDGPIAHGRFRDFDLYLEAKLAPHAQAAIYFHAHVQDGGAMVQGLKVQLNNSSFKQRGLAAVKTGSLCGIRNLYQTIVRDEVWFPLEISVRGNHVVVKVDGIPVVDYVEPTDPSLFPPGFPRLGEGALVIECASSDSPVRFRQIWIRPLPPQPRITPPPLKMPPTVYRQLLALYQQGFPVLDLHAHLKGGLTMDEILQRFYQTGIGYGVAINAGRDFSITNDVGIHRWLQSFRGLPVFLAMQAEGREWTNLFSPHAVAQFDYVFTDAMTLIDPRGKRIHLWIDREVQIKDPQAFMDWYVDQIVQILSHEPIDIYVNATYLPRCLAEKYDQLWTQERMLRVIEAAAQHGVAIEINDRFRIPSPAFIRLAKAHGVKFTFGTNNDRPQNLGYLAYCLRMIRECKLQPSDLFLPGQRPSRIQRILAARRRPVDQAWVYVGTYTQKSGQGIEAWRADLQTGQLRRLGCVAQLPNPSFLAVNRKATRLYAVSEIYPKRGRGEGQVYAYAINPTNGTLRFLNTAPSGGKGPCHLCVAADDSAVLTANYGSGSVGLIALNPDGSLAGLVDVVQHQGHSLHPTRQKGPHAHCVVPTPDGRYYLVADLGTDRVEGYTIQHTNSTWKLLPIPSLTLRLPPGSGPRHIAFHPDGRHGYVVNELANTVTAFLYDPQKPALQWLGTWSTLSAGFVGSNTAAEIAAHPSGKWLYVSNRGDDSIAVFSVLLDGNLVLADTVSSGGRWPRQFALDPNGRWLWVGNRRSDQITIFRIDPVSGLPRKTDRRLRVSSPACILFVPIPR